MYSQTNVLVCGRDDIGLWKRTKKRNFGKAPC